MSGRQRATLLGVAVAIALAAVLVAVLAGGDDDAATDGSTRPTATAPASTAPSATTVTTAPRITTIVVRDGKPVGGVKRITLPKGSTIRFAVRSDSAQEIHFHGYDVARDVPAGGTATFSVPATIDGRFVVELERTGTQIAEVDVEP